MNNRSVKGRFYSYNGTPKNLADIVEHGVLLGELPCEIPVGKPVWFIPDVATAEPEGEKSPDPEAAYHKIMDEADPGLTYPKYCEYCGDKLQLGPFMRTGSVVFKYKAQLKCPKYRSLLSTPFHDQFDVGVNTKAGIINFEEFFSN